MEYINSHNSKKLNLRKIVIYFILNLFGITVFISLIFTPFYQDLSVLNPDSGEMRPIGRALVLKSIIFEKEIYQFIPKVSFEQKKKWGQPWRTPTDRPLVLIDNEEFSLFIWIGVEIPLSIFISALLLYVMRRRFIL